MEGGRAGEREGGKEGGRGLGSGSAVPQQFLNPPVRLLVAPSPRTHTRRSFGPSARELRVPPTPPTIACPVSRPGRPPIGRDDGFGRRRRRFVSGPVREPCPSPPRRDVPGPIPAVRFQSLQVRRGPGPGADGGPEAGIGCLVSKTSWAEALCCGRTPGGLRLPDHGPRAAGRRSTAPGPRPVIKGPGPAHGRSPSRRRLEAAACRTRSRSRLFPAADSFLPQTGPDRWQPEGGNWARRVPRVSGRACRGLETNLHGGTRQTQRLGPRSSGPRCLRPGWLALSRQTSWTRAGCEPSRWAAAGARSLSG